MVLAVESDHILFNLPALRDGLSLNPPNWKSLIEVRFRCKGVPIADTVRAPQSS